MYPAELVQPMREDLTLFGFSELLTADQVDEAVHRDGTVLDNTDLSDINTSIATKQTIAKDTTGGYVGLTLFRINFKLIN